MKPAAVRWYMAGFRAGAAGAGVNARRGRPRLRTMRPAWRDGLADGAFALAMFAGAYAARVKALAGVILFAITITITSAGCGQVSESEALVTPPDRTMQMTAPDAGAEHAAAAADAGAPEASPEARGAAPDAVGTAIDAGAAESPPPSRMPRCAGNYVVERSCTATCGICKLADQPVYIDGCWLTGTDTWCVSNCLDCGKAPAP
jgi:hypothetical protein